MEKRTKKCRLKVYFDLLIPYWIFEFLNPGIWNLEPDWITGFYHSKAGVGWGLKVTDLEFCVLSDF